MTLDRVMLEQVAANPERLMYQDQQGVLSAAQLAGASAALSKVIASSTDRATVAVCLPTIKEYPVAVFATLLAGKTVVPINFLLQPRELLHVFKDSGADLVITSKHFAEKLEPLGVRTLLIEELAQHVGDPVKPEAAAKPQDVAVLLYTSGTTSLPKGVKLTHTNLIAQRDSLGEILDFPQFHILSALPLFHTFALTVAVVLPALSEARASLLPRFDPAEVLAALPQFGANTVVAVPSMYRMLAKTAKRSGGSDAKSLGLTLAIAGGEKLPTEVREEFERTFGLELCEGYGLTEHSPAVALNIPGANRPGTIGRPIPGVEWCLVKEDGSQCAPGEEGELRVRSASVMAGYHNHEESPVDAEGWLATGDLARVDDGGYLSITGRIKELIIAAGKNIHPSEIEDVVSEHEAVAECAVIGMPDKTRGEAPACFIVVAEGAELSEEALRDWLKDRLADYKRPRLISFMDELPHGPTGKVFKRALKRFLP